MRYARKAQQRLWRQESGFTLIELLIVLVIIAILLAIAVPSYLGFRDRASSRAAQSDIRAAMPSAEVYYNDNLTYVGMTVGALQTIDAGTNPSLVVGGLGANVYCLGLVVGGKSWSVRGPGSGTNWYSGSTTCTGVPGPPGS